jgi:hypothetical protein
MSLELAPGISSFCNFQTVDLLDSESGSSGDNYRDFDVELVEVSYGVEDGLIIGWSGWSLSTACGFGCHLLVLGHPMACLVVST